MISHSHLYGFKQGMIAYRTRSLQRLEDKLGYNLGLGHGSDLQASPAIHGETDANRCVTAYKF